MNDHQKNALDFLLYSYFSFSLKNLAEDEGDAIAYRIIERAYRDASSHVLSIQSNDPHEEAVKRIMEGLNCICKQDKCTFDTWHNNLCSSLLSLYAEAGCEWGKSNGRELAFSYGIAQKWVNMTMKYLMITADLCALLIDSDQDSAFMKQYGEMTAKHRCAFHAPVDRYIIDAAGIAFTDIVLPTEKKSLHNRRYPSDYVTPWSRWDLITYRRFYVSLRKNLKDERPLDWEGPAWIEAAKRKNGK
jgi:hypothetical protein